jgi:hypothetical protein
MSRGHQHTGIPGARSTGPGGPPQALSGHQMPLEAAKVFEDSQGAKRAAGPKVHKGPHSCPETVTGLQGSLCDPVLLQISKGRHRTHGPLQIVRCRRRTLWGATTGLRSLYRSPGAARGLQDLHRPFNASIRHHGHRKSPVTTINVQESVITVL